MKANQHTALVSDRVVLVPYRKEHVEKYHEWMQDPELREQTASEPLTLEQEYEMQQKWAEDEDSFVVPPIRSTHQKPHDIAELTFIVLARLPPDEGELSDEELRKLPMVGDVNLFFKGKPGDEGYEIEVEVMIAEKEYRRNHLAHRALCMMLAWVTHVTPSDSSPLPVYNPKSFVARISSKNAGSIKLFRKLGFFIVKKVEVFDEVETRYMASGFWEAGDERHYE